MTRENPRARFAFLCPYPFFVHTIKTVVSRMPEAEIVPDFTATPGGQAYPRETKERFMLLLEKSGLPYRVFETAERSPLEFFNKYATLIAPYHEGWVAHPVNQSKKKVRVFYGGAKDPWAVGLWNAYFDLICSPGPYHSERLALYQNIVMQTGEPKLDGLFEHAPKEECLKRLGITLDAKKETILVVSTWGTLSALPHLAPHLIALTNTYNIVVKAHHMTLTFEQSHIKVFDGSPVHIVDDAKDICDALAISDYVVSDNSGAIFDALHAEKPLILIESDSSKSSFLVDDPFLLPSQRYRGTITSSDSIEQTIKTEHHIAPVVTLSLESDPLRAITHALREATLQDFKEKQKQFMRATFSPHDGRSGERVAEQIYQLDSKHTHVSRPIVTLVREFERRLTQRQLRKDEVAINTERIVTQEIARIKRLPPLQRIRALVHAFFYEK